MSTQPDALHLSDATSLHRIAGLLDAIASVLHDEGHPALAHDAEAACEVLEAIADEGIAAELRRVSSLRPSPSEASPSEALDTAGAETT